MKQNSVEVEINLVALAGLFSIIWGYPSIMKVIYMMAKLMAWIHLFGMFLLFPMAGFVILLLVKKKIPKNGTQKVIEQAFMVFYLGLISGTLYFVAWMIEQAARQNNIEGVLMGIMVYAMILGYNYIRRKNKK